MSPENPHAWACGGGKGREQRGGGGPGGGPECRALGGAQI